MTALGTARAAAGQDPRMTAPGMARAVARTERDPLVARTERDPLAAQTEWDPLVAQAEQGFI